MKYETKHGYVVYGEQTDTLLDDDGYETESDPYIMIDLVYVEKKYRRNGIARNMLTEVIAMLRQQPLDVKLAALPHDGIDLESLVAFYESLGFTPSSGQGSAAVIMEL